MLEFNERHVICWACYWEGNREKLEFGCECPNCGASDTISIWDDNERFSELYGENWNTSN